MERDCRDVISDEASTGQNELSPSVTTVEMDGDIEHDWAKVCRWRGLLEPFLLLMLVVLLLMVEPRTDPSLKGKGKGGIKAPSCPYICKNKKREVDGSSTIVPIVREKVQTGYERKAGSNRTDYACVCVGKGIYASTSVLVQPHTCPCNILPN